MRNQKGFTLIELLVVIAIIGLLATIAVVSLTGPRKTARDTKRLADMATMRTGFELYNTDKATYPPVPSPVVLGTGVYTQLTDNGFAAPTATTYLGVVPKDPTSSGSYIYTYTSLNGAASCTVAPCNNYKITGQFEGDIQSYKVAAPGPTFTSGPSGVVQP